MQLCSLLVADAAGAFGVHWLLTKFSAAGTATADGSGDSSIDFAAGDKDNDLGDLALLLQPEATAAKRAAAAAKAAAGEEGDKNTRKQAAGSGARARAKRKTS